MIQRVFWLDKIRLAWEKAPIAWLSGVRRAGKTTLARAFPEAEFINCDLPEAAALLADPPRFYRGLTRPIVVFDEVHQLPDPSRLLKIGADEFPRLKILATGSSTLAASGKFRDTLAGRKRAVHLLPVLAWEEEFGTRDLDRRLLRGGLPEPLLAAERDAGFYAEWLDSFYARDIQELFRVRERHGFLRLLELCLRQSGGELSASALSRLCGLSRPTVLSYLEVFQVAHVLCLLRPFAGGGRREFTRQPRAFAFDTGFVAFARGWRELRPEDRGALWEHLCLDLLRAALPPGASLHYWRDRRGREVDFVIPRGRGVADAVEAKWDPDRFSPAGLAAFRQSYPAGRNFILSPVPARPHARRFGELEVVCASPWSPAGVLPEG